MGEHTPPDSGRPRPERTLVMPPFCDGNKRLTSGLCMEGSYNPTEPEKEPAARSAVPLVWS